MQIADKDLGTERLIRRGGVILPAIVSLIKSPRLRCLSFLLMGGCSV